MLFLIARFPILVKPLRLLIFHTCNIDLKDNVAFTNSTKGMHLRLETREIQGHPLEDLFAMPKVPFVLCCLSGNGLVVVTGHFCKGLLNLYF